MMSLSSLRRSIKQIIININDIWNYFSNINMHFDVYSVRDKYWPRISTPEILLLWLKENVKERPKVKRTLQQILSTTKKLWKYFVYQTELNASLRAQIYFSFAFCLRCLLEQKNNSVIGEHKDHRYLFT